MSDVSSYVKVAMPLAVLATGGTTARSFGVRQTCALLASERANLGCP